MDRVPVYVGLDYHSKSVQVCVVDQKGKVLCNKKQGSSLHEVIAAIEPCGSVERVAIEACSGASDFGDHLNRSMGWRVSLAHPGMVSRMRASIDKTDTSDARVLADLCRTNYLPEVWLPPEFIRQLRSLVTRRQQRVTSIQECKQRIRALLRDKRVVPTEYLGIGWTKRYFLWLETVELPPMIRFVIDDLLNELRMQIQAKQSLEALLKRVAAQDERIQFLIAKFKGVGLITACAIRAVIGEFDRFRNGKQFSRYCGLTPRNASSGERVSDAGIVRAGNPTLKSLLIQVAHRVVRNDEHWKETYRRLTKRGKPVCVAIVAVANRWCRAIWHSLKSFEQTMDQEKRLAVESKKNIRGGEVMAA